MARNSDNRAGPLAAQEHGTAMELAVPSAVVDRASQAAPGRDSGRALRLLGLVAVAVGLAALTAAACALSYSSIHHLATAAGVSPKLASIYPLIFDALLVIAGCSVLALRGAGLVSRIYGWFCLLVLLGGLAAGGAVHAAAIRIPRRLAGVVAAVVPWAIVLIGFGLLLALLRYARLRRLGPQPDEPARLVAAPGAGVEAADQGDLVVMANTAEPPDRAAAPADAVTGRSGGQPDADLVKEAWPRSPVRQADMQLRARIPRQSAEQAPAGQVTARHAPFMPPVGPLPPTGSPESGHQPDPSPSGDRAPSIGATNPDPARGPEPGSTGATNPLPGRGPEPGSTGATNPLPARGTEPGSVAAAGPAPAGTGDAGSTSAASTRPADLPAEASTLNPAPVVDDADDEPGQPPMLKRPHSSPTPPQD